MRGAALALLVLAGFAGCTPMQWVKPEAAPEQMQKDAAECRDAAWREASYRYYAAAPFYGYPRYYGYSPWHYPPYARYGYSALPGGFYQERFHEEERLAQFCMRAKGYQLVPAERSAAE